MIFLSFLLRKFPVYAVSLLMLGLMTVQPLAASELVEEAGEEANLSEKSGDLEFAIGSAEDLSGVHSAVQEEDFQGLDERESSLVVDAQSPDFLAQETEDAELSFPEGGLLRITVTGTRTPRSIEDLPATVTVFDLEDLEFNGVVNLRDLLRYEPGVSVRNDLRYGLQDVNIRGIEGNRILFQLDGIRLPERFEFGPFNVGRGDYVDFATLSTVEVLRGPASTLYGSDALGGVITFRSLRPDDLLTPGETFALDIPFVYTSYNAGFSEAIRLAGRNDTGSEAVFVVSRIDAREAIVRADSSLIDPQDRSGTTLYGNFVHNFDDFSNLSIILEDFNRDTRTTTAEANLGSPAPGTVTTSFVEDILIDRWRVALAYEFDDPDNPGWLQYALARAYYQDTTETEVNLENRISRGTPLFRETTNRLTSQAVGGEAQFRSDFTTGDLSHQLTYGIEASNTFNSRPRDRVQTNLITGESTRNIPPDTFPVKDFPDSDTLRIGAYLQDEITWGPVDLIAGLRFDYYDLSPSPDEAFNRNGAEAAGLEASSLSPRLAVLYNATPELSVYGQYARGFRAPLYSEINSGFTNTTGRFFKYQTIPNPDLQPETSNSFEVGIRGRYPQFDFGLTGFYNTYNNFIETFQPAGIRCLVEVDPCPTFSPALGGTAQVNVFQTQNISDARIFGVELGTEYRFSPSSDGFSLLGSLAWVQGDDLTRDEPLRSVDPLKAVVGLRYRSPNDIWRAELLGSIVGTARVPEGTTTFVPSSYAVLDLLGQYNISPNVGLNLGIYNLLNTRYFIYSDTRNVPADAPDINRYSQPGTYVRVGVNLEF